MLTSEQIAHFETFGFLVLKQHFSTDEIAIMKTEAEEIYLEDRGGDQFDDIETQYIQPFFERKPYLSSLIDTDRIYMIGEDLLGPDFILDGTEGRLRVGPTPWHGGKPEKNSLPHVKINIYPDPLTKNTGCLRVVPGSHLFTSPDLYEQLRTPNYSPDYRPFGMAPEDIYCVPLEVQSGDVVVFKEYTLHSSFGGSSGRHQLACVFFANPVNEDHVKHLADIYKTAKWSLRPSESFINSERPRIRRMVSKLVELGFEPLPY